MALVPIVAALLVVGNLHEEVVEETEVSLGSVRLLPPDIDLGVDAAAASRAVHLDQAKRLARVIKERMPPATRVGWPTLPGLHILLSSARVTAPRVGASGPPSVPVVSSTVDVCSDAEVVDGVELYARGSANLGVPALSGDGERLRVTGTGLLGLQVGSGDRLRLRLEVTRSGWSQETPRGVEARSLASLELAW